MQNWNFQRLWFVLVVQNLWHRIQWERRTEEYRTSLLKFKANVFISPCKQNYTRKNPWKWLVLVLPACWGWAFVAPKRPPVEAAGCPKAEVAGAPKVLVELVAPKVEVWVVFPKPPNPVEAPPNVGLEPNILEIWNKTTSLFQNTFLALLIRLIVLAQEEWCAEWAPSNILGHEIHDKNICQNL